MMISIGVIGNNIKIAFATVILWAIYLIIHIILLTTLIKRRFNYITPNKTNLLFSLWIIAFAILLAFSFYIAIMFISMGSHIEIKFNPEWMSPIILLLSFAMPILKPLVLGTIIFLMIREKPVN